ncbi:MAG: class A beta-lactamase-related serine hydrolase [Bradyrhizobiaceae bacterium]|nr:MAG: class A beta-lactamase-related serine hydrolase [Bradyrhizobiaceae bacterium]
MLAAAGGAAGEEVSALPKFSQEKLERVTGLFNDEVTEGKIPGAIVFIEQAGKEIYFRCFGTRDAATGAPMTPDTIFALTSLTKPITNFAAMMLIDRGQMNLDDPIAKYIPAFTDVKVGEEVKVSDKPDHLDIVPPVRPPTIRDLMRQTSGITYDYIGGDLIRKVYKDANLFEGKFDNAVLANRIARLPLSRQPGSTWRYGHSTDVLGRVIEVVSGQSLYEFEKQNLFDPLGMHDTKFILTEAERARKARPLPTDNVLIVWEAERRAHPEWQSGGGGLFSTVTDYAQFLRMILGRGVLAGRRYLSENAFAEMTRDQIGPGSGVGRDFFYFPGDGFDYGLGFGIRVAPGNAVPPPPGSIGELKWDGGSGVYFGVDPKLQTIYMLFMQSWSQRGRIQPAAKKLIYDAVDE